ncbi:helix-turn-helix domain-containing protein [Streptomyces sp. CBMA29]|uniref:helix-turn-helix domain-containing protein n=1 Tax=Streptomyces sp. CBMA29 TaxID=1896314 RepID=UPI001661F57F|nr:helix-turn-helix transcriptional regulator [Streptomyces sp. CBMA29]MBD0737120.1 DNA-binding protein [Streptomyces sp. CBMA29]
MNDRANRGTSISTVLGRKLGGDLLRMRETCGLKQSHAAEALTASVPKVAKMERGLVPMRDPDIRALCHLYGVEDETVIAGLLQIARLDRERRRAKGWWKPDAGNLSEYIAMEDIAVRVRTWQLSLIPGLFQTPDYVRALAVSGGIWEDPDAIERLVAVRLKRQARLQGENPLSVHAVIWEGALRQLVGGAEVMREQLSHIYDLAKLPNVHIQVLPFRAGGHPSISGPFSILSFLDSAAMDVVHTDTIASTQWVEDSAQGAVYASFFAATARLSLSPYGSSRLIDDIGKGLHE